MTRRGAMKALAVSFPQTIRTNDYYRTRHPNEVAAAEERALAKLWARGAPADAFGLEMQRYLDDPFRGTVERRVLAPGETVLSMEERAARSVLQAAGMTAGDVDLLILTSFLPDQVGVGNATFLARALGLHRPAWNLETACSSSHVAFQTACGLVEAEQYRNVLVVSSCAYSRTGVDADSLSWFMGDGAGAFVVGEAKGDEGLLGMESVATTETCDTFSYRIADEPGAASRVRIQCTPSTGRVLHETSEPYMRACCDGAMRKAGVKLGDIAFFVFNTPTAWFAAFATRALGIPAGKTISTYDRYANIGPALLPANLYEALRQKRIVPDDLVLFYSVGSVSTASASVVRWADCKLGQNPDAFRGMEPVASK